MMSWLTNDTRFMMEKEVDGKLAPKMSWLIMVVSF